MQPEDARLYFRKVYVAFVCLFFGAGAFGWMVPSIRVGGHIDMLADLFVAGLAAALTVYGFTVLREKRVIENLPPSRVRSVAMGLAELSGAARQKLPLVSPLAALSCVYFRYLIEEERSSSRSREWVTIDKGESSQPFYLEDETGKILVDPAGAETILRQDYREIRRDGGWTSRRTRYTEWVIAPGEPITVVGTAGPTRDIVWQQKAALVDRLQQLKKHPEQMKQFDTDGDGQISPEEWEKAVQKAKDDVLQDEVRREAAQPEDDVVVGKGTEEKTFVISDRGERSLVQGLALKAGASLLFGPSILALMAASLLARTGLLPKGLAIPWERFVS